MTGSIFEPGERIADYVIEKQMGKGGMAELFLASDSALKRKVVIKIMSPPFSENEGFKKQFLREARIQANLDNPHIVQILRIFEHRDNYCLVMPHVKGTDLSRVIKKAMFIRETQGVKGALSMERAVHILLQALEGIGFAHKYMIIHGDIKPSNILLNETGRVKVADFGLAFLSSQREYKKEAVLQGGTPSYMSPEQILNQEVDFRSDIYSLGVTFFHMLTGGFPSGDRTTMMELLEYHMEGSTEEAREALEALEGLRPNIKDALLKALQGESDLRHQSCLEFSLAIKEDAPYEMYSELLRLSLLTKDSITPAERAYLDSIARKKGLSPEEAKTLEKNMRKEMGLPL